MFKKFILCAVLFSAKFISAQTEVVVQAGHTERVGAIAYSHNGLYLLTGGNDNTIILWDFKSGMQVRTFTGHSKGIASLAFTNDDQRFISGSYDQTIKIWETNTGKCINTIVGYGFAFTQTVFSPDGHFMAATNRDHTFSLWDLRNPTPVFHTFQSSENYGDMGDVCFDTLNNVYFCAWDGTIYMKNILKDSDYSHFDTLRTPPEYGYLNALEVTADGKYLIGGCDGSGDAGGDFFIMEKATHQIVYHNPNYIAFMGSYSQAISISANNQYVAYCTNKDGVHILNLNSLQTDYKFPLPDCDAIKFSQAGLYLSCASGSVVTEYNVRLGTALHEYKGYTKGVKKIQISNDGKIVSYHDKALLLWDLTKAKGEPIAENILPSIEGNYVVNADRSLLAYEKKNKIYFYDLNRKENTYVLKKTNDYSNDLLFSKDGKHFSVTSQEETIYRLPNFERIWYTPKLEYGDFCNPYFSPDNELYISSTFSMNEFAILPIGSKYKSVIAYSANDIGPFAASEKYVAAIIKDRLDGTQSAFLSDVQNSYEKDTARVVEDMDFLISSASMDRPKYIVVWDRNSLEIKRALKLPKSDRDDFTETPEITALDFDSTGVFIAMASSDNIIRIWNVETGKIEKQMRAHAATITSVSYTAGNRYLVSSSADGSIIIWDGTTYEQLATMLLIGNEDYIIVTPENYYTCSKYGTSGLAFRKGNTMYPFSQFDLIYNRPDKVLERLKCADKQLIESLKKAYEKRLQKAGIKEESLNDEIHIPEINIENIYSIPLNATKAQLELFVTAKDEQSKIKTIQVYINDVPQCGTYTVDTKADDAHYVEKSISIRLMNGRNKISVSCLNQAGVESIPMEAEVNFIDSGASKVYFIGIAVAHYQDSNFNLKYTVKDIRDMAKALKKKYPNIIIDTLLNERATRDNILKLKQRLASTMVNDMVVMAISGHGLLSKNLDFYYATYDVNFHDPALKGIKYEDLEGLYDCIAARKKLLLLDACHSGEVDRDGNMVVKDVLPEGVKETRTKGSQLLESADNISLSSSFELMQQIFANLSKGNGSVVISAAGGQEYALESDQWANGVFTYCVLQALVNNKADANNDQKTSISELKKYVSAEVQKLTGGRQKPTNRRENLLFDWQVW